MPTGRRDRERDQIDALLLADVRDVEAIAENRDRVHAHAAQAPVVVDEADRPVLPAAVLNELPRQKLPRVPGADDQHVLTPAS